MNELTTLTVGELKEMLNGYDDDMKVAIAQPTHDHWHNVKASPINDNESMMISYSDYHSAFTILDDDTEEEGEDIVMEEVLILQ